MCCTFVELKVDYYKLRVFFCGDDDDTNKLINLSIP